MGRWVIPLAGLFGALGVVAGAIGSHVMKARLSGANFEIFTTAVTYLMLHAVVLLLCGVLIEVNKSNKWFKIAGILLVIGIVLFCGGLIVRVAADLAIFGKMAPMGGAALIGAWLAIAVGGIANYGQSK